MPASVIVVMGVSGCGKSTVGKLLADKLQCDFLEGDSLHPASNVAKMSSGVPLTDEDRMPWLQVLHTKIREHLNYGRRLVVTCSALKPAYRHVLQYGIPQPYLVPSKYPPHMTATAPGVTRAAPGAPSSREGSRRDDASDRGGATELGDDRASEVAFVLLDPAPAELRRRLEARERAGGHFMPASLLESQLATLSYCEDELFAHFRDDGGRGGDVGVRGPGSTGARNPTRACDPVATDINGRDEDSQDRCGCPDPQAIVDMLLTRL